jgi:hypothetical protein
MGQDIGNAVTVLVHVLILSSANHRLAARIVHRSQLQEVSRDGLLTPAVSKASRLTSLARSTRAQGPKIHGSQRLHCKLSSLVDWFTFSHGIAGFFTPALHSKCYLCLEPKVLPMS